MATPSMPAIILGGGSAGNPAGYTGISQLQIAYGNLLTGAADFTGTGARAFVLTAGAIETAALAQIGVTETAAEVAVNAAVLRQISAFCTTNGIKVHVLAELTNSATYGSGPNAINALTDQWGTAAAKADLPIASITDVDEIGFTQPIASFSTLAAIEVVSYKTLIRDYVNSGYIMTSDNLSIGDMECGSTSDTPKIGQWWSTFDRAAAAAGIPGFSSFTTDTGGTVPWLGVETDWQSSFVSLASLAKLYNMAVNVTVQGSKSEPSAPAFVRQAEQYAAAIAQLQASGSVTVDQLTLQTWQSQPINVGEITSPTSTANEAAEINATYPLYLVGSITAQGAVSVTTPGQLLLNTGTAHSIGPLSIHWNASDIQAGNRIGVVLIGQTAALSATRYGSGTVSSPAANILVLSGNATDLELMLGSVLLTESNAGPDTIDVETYGQFGRLSDNQIAVLAAAVGQSVNAIASTSNGQGWISSSSFLNSGNVVTDGAVMTSQTLNWNTTGTLAGTTTPGQAAFVKTVGIHEPMAAYGIKDVSLISNGTTIDTVLDIYDPSVDIGVFPAGGYANDSRAAAVIAPQVTGWLGFSFDAHSQLIPLIVSSTTSTFNPVSGLLEQMVDILAPDPLTIIDKTGTHPDKFSTAFNNGGTQVVEYNTGDNGAWLRGWGSQFSSVTRTYDSAGKMVEEFFQGGTSNPAFTLDYVFSPTNGQLWEVFNSIAPPQLGLGVNNVTGPMYQTQFLGSPLWNGKDWGWTATSDTEVWADWIIIGNFTGTVENFPDQYARAGKMNQFSYEFVNGSTLDLMNLPGTMDVNLNTLGYITLNSETITSGLSGLNSVDAFGATGTVTLTGLVMGGSTLIGGDGTSLLTGYGHDEFIAGAGVTTINTGRGRSTVLVSSAAGSTTVSGDWNVVTAVAGSMVTFNGVGNTLNGSNVTAYVDSNTSLTINGSNDTIVLRGTGITLNVLGGYAVAVHGTSADVAANLDDLESLNAKGELGPIMLTESGAPVLSLSAASIASNAGALARITGPYTLNVAAGTATDNAGALARITGPDVLNATGVTTADTAIAVFDTSHNQPIGVRHQPYTGPVSGIQNEYIGITADSLNVAVTTPNWFLHSGGGDDALSVSSGRNVLDGATGSNFLVGGTGSDTFYADARGASADIWDTIVNFHAGDAVTIWGVTPADFNVSFVGNQGATGYTGLTLTATAPGRADVRVTFAGLNMAALSNGTISETSGIEPVSGSTYTYFYANA